MKAYEGIHDIILTVCVISEFAILFTFQLDSITQDLTISQLSDVADYLEDVAQTWTAKIFHCAGLEDCCGLLISDNHLLLECPLPICALCFKKTVGEEGF